MIILYTWATQNGQKASIMLEEVGIEYRVVPVNLTAREQYAPEFLKLAPNNKIPAIVDEDVAGGPLAIFESTAILQYLAEKTGKFLAPAGRVRYETLQWLHWHAAGLAAIAAQYFYFTKRVPERAPQALARFEPEMLRLLGVMDRRLASAVYLGGEDYSIADIANFSWAQFARGLVRENLTDGPEFPHLDRWVGAVRERAAVQRGMAVPRPNTQIQP